MAHGAYAQALKNVSLKFNMGVSFSGPEDDLALGYMKGKENKFFTEAEIAKHLNYGKSDGLGLKLALVLGKNSSNVLRNDGLTQLNVGITSVKARLYPLSFVAKEDDMMEGMGKIASKFPIGIDILVTGLLWGSFNGLHFDYGTGFSKITESTFDSDYYTFPEQSIKRNLTYFGWGFQPQFLQSSSGKWTANAVLDFGKYKWTNNAGRTSSLKYAYAGFGVQYHIK
ncbi:hypothetical protein MASR2M52_15000 [Pedobacter sp.]